MLAAVRPGGNTLAIAVFDCRNMSSVRGDIDLLSEEKATLILALPELIVRAYYWSVAMKCTARRESLPARYLDASFTPANSSAIIRVFLTINPGSNSQSLAMPVEFCLIIPTSVIMHRLPRGAVTSAPITVQWEDWGTETRFFKASQCNDYQVDGDGPRCIMQDEPSAKQYILDFRPPDLLLHDLANAGSDEDVDIVVQPTRVQNGDVFCRPVVTKAPYRRLETGLPAGEDILCLGVNGAVATLKSSESPASPNLKK